MCTGSPGAHSAGVRFDRAERAAERAADRYDLIRIMPAKGAKPLSPPTPKRPDVVIVGAGVIGLAVGWRAAQRGLAVTLVDPEPAGGASHVAAGMITPVSELTYGEEPLLLLGIASRELYPSFVAELEELTGLRTDHRADGLLQVAFDADDLAFLNDLRLFQESLGITAEALTGRECRRMEPMLAPSVRGGLLAPEDGSIDPRLLTAALLAALDRTGGTIVRERATDVILESGVTAGVRLESGAELRAERVVLAAGCRIGDLGGLPPGVLPEVRPVKGQVLRLRSKTPMPRRATRGVVRGSSIYLVPRADGDLVIGATQEELGFDTTVTAGGLWELLRDARELMPGVTELEYVEAIAGLRPCSPDNAPVLGAAGPPGLFLAAGHFRHGVLLTPVTADALAEALVSGSLPEVARPFGMDRFAKEARA